MPITNYEQMKTIFDRPVVVNMKDLFSPCNLIATINHLADNKADGTTYAHMTTSDRTTSTIVSVAQLSFAALVSALLA
jgi:hypothetical protein